jgi:protein phosphatase
VSHRRGRRAIFVGDLVDRGPDSAGVLRLVMDMAAAGNALAVPGNHDDKLLRALQGRPVQRKYGLAETLAQIESRPPEFKAEVQAFLAGLPSHYRLDGGRLVVAHAGLIEPLQGRLSRRVRDFALYGLTTGETDQYGLPVRLLWAKDYRGRAFVVYGHTPVVEPLRLNHTLNIDTGCAFGGRLTALRYPEQTLVSVPAHQTYYAPQRPFLTSADAV